MDEVYISGALTAIADGARARVFYELLAEIVSDCGLRPYLPHQTTDPIAAPDLDPRSVYDIDRARVARAGLLIAYAGTPSFGVGIEVEIARERGIPVILVAERDRTVSRILLGSPAVVDIVRFTDLAALRQSLGEAIARVTRTAGDQAPDAVVQRFLGSLGAARQLPEAEVAALLRVAELDGEPAGAIRRAIGDGKPCAGPTWRRSSCTTSSSGRSPRSPGPSAPIPGPSGGGSSRPGSSCSSPPTRMSRS
jgi:hypothetical protein